MYAVGQLLKGNVPGKDVDEKLSNAKAWVEKTKVAKNVLT